MTARAAPAWWGNAAFLTSFVFLIAAWQLSGLFLNKIFISTPSAIVTAFAEILGDGTLIRKFADSALDMGVGIVIASVLGIGLGVLMGRSPRMERAFEPIVNFANATPTIALLPLMEIWFGLGMAARVSFIVIISVWTLLINTLTGIKNVRAGHRDVARSFGMTRIQATRSVYVPAAMPFILAGLRIALAQAAVGMILSGQEIGEFGLGGLTQQYATFYQTAHLIATILSSTALAMLAFAALRIYQAMRHPWIAATAAGRR
ncbi:MAG TPA: ABC transporter permease [Candidatus Limnocylindria bacterium]|nr:ABC transporter permease [Candidatus Limnocylindria bacterium]